MQGAHSTLKCSRRRSGARVTHPPKFTTSRIESRLAQCSRAIDSSFCMSSSKVRTRLIMFKTCRRRDSRVSWVPLMNVKHSVAVSSAKLWIKWESSMVLISHWRSKPSPSAPTSSSSTCPPSATSVVLYQIRQMVHSHWP